MISRIRHYYDIFLHASRTEDIELIQYVVRDLYAQFSIPKLYIKDNIIYPLDIIFNLKKDFIIFQDAGYNILWSNQFHPCHHERTDCYDCPVVACHLFKRPIYEIFNWKIYFVTPCGNYFIILLKKLS